VAGSSSRRPQHRGLDTRHKLLLAALHEFASVGFDAASTRAIAARAGVRQGQLTYHFDTKDVLWRATVDHLFERFDAEFSAAVGSSSVTGGDDPVAEFEEAVRALVRVVSRLPELNRVMVHESTADSDRLTWLVDTHVRPRFEQVSAVWLRVRDIGGTHLEADPLVLYYCLLGAASLLYVNATEARRLAGTDASADIVTDALTAAHADTLVAMLLGPRSRRASRRRTPTVERSPA
jgi:TetR/AcrR family transcriptional regulator